MNSRIFFCLVCALLVSSIVTNKIIPEDRFKECTNNDPKYFTGVLSPLRQVDADGEHVACDVNKGDFKNAPKNIQVVRFWSEKSNTCVLAQVYCIFNKEWEKSQHMKSDGEILLENGWMRAEEARKLDQKEVEEKPATESKIDGHAWTPKDETLDEVKAINKSPKVKELLLKLEAQIIEEIKKQNQNNSN
jgi:hypothetical protein